jgi:hypothetical protein
VETAGKSGCCYCWSRGGREGKVFHREERKRGRERGGAATTQGRWVFECDVGCSGKDGGESGGGGRRCG